MSLPVALLVAAGVLAAVAVVLLRWAGELGRARADLRARGVRVAGRVISGSAFGPTRAVEYPLPDGSFATLTVPATRPATLDPGQAVPVLVDPLDPHHAVVETAAQASLPRILLLVWGAICLLAAGGLLLSGLVGLALS